MRGTFYGVGTGPGDPELLTKKALRILGQCHVLVLPVSDGSFAESVYDETGSDEAYVCWQEKCAAYKIVIQAEPELAKKAKLYVPMPMIKDQERLARIHDGGAEAAAGLLDAGMDLAFITLGDPSVYSTCMYLFKRVLKKGYEAELIPGVPSFCAAAARLRESLAENRDELHVLPASYGIEAGLNLAGTKVLMKAGSRMADVKRAVQENGGSLYMVENCGMEGEKAYRFAEEIPDDAGYYSLLIVKEGRGKEN